MLKRNNGVPKVEPCDICGDVGFSEVIVTCSKCNVNREHMYCMRIVLTEIPDYWLCESCEATNGATSPREVKQNFSLQALKRKHFARTGPGGKVKFIPGAEVIKLNSFNSSMKPTPASSNLPMTQKALPTRKPFPGSSSFLMTSKSHVASRSLIPKVPSRALKPNPCISPITQGKFPRNGVQKSPMTNHQVSASKGPAKEYRLASERRVSAPIPDRKVQTLDHQIESPTKGAPCKDLSARKLPPVAVSGAVAERNKYSIEKSNIQNVSENFFHDRKYLPSSILAWRGQFQILQAAASGEFYDGFEAQPPCIVNRKAFNFSNKMPSVLQMEALPTLSVLSDAFQNDSPTIQDIALYFFPSDNNGRSRENLKSIFKFMSAENSTLRSVINGVELLIFTSNQLSHDSRGTIDAVNEGYFLWGTFRVKKTDIANKTFTDMEPIDMDIDMMGGNDVAGRIDHVLNDNLKRPCQLPLEGPPIQIQSTISEKVEENTLTPSSNLNFYGGKSISSEGLRKKIKSEHCSEPSSWNPVKKYGEMFAVLDAPPGFEAHGKYPL